MNQPRSQRAATPVVHLSSSPLPLATTTDKGKGKAIASPVRCNVHTYCNALLVAKRGLLPW